MLYVVELDFIQTDRLSAWNAWYMHHLDVLLTVPGFQTAQRFLCTRPHSAPYLALYTVDSPAVFASEAYCARGGRDSTGEWKASMVNWDRNVFAGVDRAPAVSSDEVLLLTEDMRAAGSLAEIAFCPLIAVGLDRTVTRRALAVAPARQPRDVAQWNTGPIRAYRALMPQRVTGGTWSLRPPP